MHKILATYPEQHRYLQAECDFILVHMGELIVVSVHFTSRDDNELQPALDSLSHYIAKAKRIRPAPIAILGDFNASFPAPCGPFVGPHGSSSNQSHALLEFVTTHNLIAPHTHMDVGPSRFPPQGRQEAPSKIDWIFLHGCILPQPWAISLHRPSQNPADADFITIADHALLDARKSTATMRGTPHRRKGVFSALDTSASVWAHHR